MDLLKNLINFKDVIPNVETSAPVITGVSALPESNGLLQSYFPNQFVDALVPVNPRHWMGYWVGSAVESKANILSDKLTEPF